MGENERLSKCYTALQNAEQYRIFLRNNRLKAILISICVFGGWGLLVMMIKIFGLDFVSIVIPLIMLIGFSIIAILYLVSAFHERPVFMMIGKIKDIKPYRKNKTTGNVLQHSFLVSDGFSDVWGTCLKYKNSGTEQEYQIGDDVVLFSITETRSYVARMGKMLI
jgi:hypothetical protein